MSALMKTRQSAACRKLGPAFETYLDGELDPAQVVEVEAHAEECACCRERLAFDRAMRRSLRRVVAVKAPDSLRAKVAAAMIDERRPTPERGADADVAGPGGFSLRYAAPLAAAACFALVFSLHKASTPVDAPSGSREPQGPQASSAAVTGLDSLLEELVAQHAQPLPSEVTRQDEVRSFDPFIGVPVEPPKLQMYGAHWLGGRMVPIRYDRAAVMQYSLAGGHRVTLSVYDPRRVNPQSRTLRERNLQDGPVYFGTVGGYNVAAAAYKGVGYALATDLDEPESLELIENAAVH